MNFNPPIHAASNFAAKHLLCIQIHPPLQVENSINFLFSLLSSHSGKRKKERRVCSCHSARPLSALLWCIWRRECGLQSPAVNFSQCIFICLKVKNMHGISLCAFSSGAGALPRPLLYASKLRYIHRRVLLLLAVGIKIHMIKLYCSSLCCCGAEGGAEAYLLPLRYRFADLYTILLHFF